MSVNGAGASAAGTDGACPSSAPGRNGAVCARVRICAHWACSWRLRGWLGTPRVVDGRMPVRTYMCSKYGWILERDSRHRWPLFLLQGAARERRGSTGGCGSTHANPGRSFVRAPPRRCGMCGRWASLSLEAVEYRRGAVAWLGARARPRV